MLSWKAWEFQFSRLKIYRSQKRILLPYRTLKKKEPVTHRLLKEVIPPQPTQKKAHFDENR